MSPTLAALSGVGLGLSLIVHVAAWVHYIFPIGKWVFALHLGIFVVFVPLVISANRTTPTPGKRDNLEHLFGTLPRWTQPLATGVFVYALAQFALFMWQASHYTKHHVPHDLELRGFSGHWIMFYTWSLLGHIGLMRYRPLPQNPPSPNQSIIS
jgi:hypothetical protein